jgi:hypothetical protein
MKTCSKCKQEKEINEYNNNSRMSDGKDYYCRPCRKIAQYNTRNNNKVRCSWNDCDRVNWVDGLCQLHYKRKIKGKPMDERKDGAQKYIKIKQCYKLTKEQYDEMAKDGCYICSSKNFLNVDHDHGCCQGKNSCGKCVRGIVCSSCNQYLGRLENGTIALVNELKPKLYQYLIDFETRKKSLG